MISLNSCKRNKRENSTKQKKVECADIYNQQKTIYFYPPKIKVVELQVKEMFNGSRERKRKERERNGDKCRNDNKKTRKKSINTKSIQWKYILSVIEKRIIFVNGAKERREFYTHTKNWNSFSFFRRWIEMKSSLCSWGSSMEFIFEFLEVLLSETVSEEALPENHYIEMDKIRMYAKKNQPKMNHKS